MPLLVVLIPLGMICPYFGNDGVLVFIVFDGHCEAHVLLYRVLDLVQLLPHVVGRVVLRASGRCPVVVALFPSSVHAPQQNGDQHEDPDDNEDGAKEGHKVVSFAGAWHAHFCNGRDDGVAPVAFANQVDYPFGDLFNGAWVQAMVFSRNADMDLIAG